MVKRKPWRKFRKKNRGVCSIRTVCSVILAVEFLVLAKQDRIPFPLVEIKQDEVTVMYPQGEEAEDSRIYGIRIRLKDGVVDFYRKEELKITH